MAWAGVLPILIIPPIARPNLTPAAERIAAGDLVRGGPMRALRFSNVSNSPRLAVRMRGILEAASSSVTLLRR